MNAREWREKKRKGELLTLPSGMEIRVCRSLQVWISSGRLPERYLSLLLRAATDVADIGADAEQALEQIKEASGFTREIVTRTVLEPRITLEETDADDEMWYDDLPDGDLQHILLYALGKLPDVKVQTTNGDLTAQAVEHFRDSGRRPVTAPSRNDFEPLLVEAE